MTATNPLLPPDQPLRPVLPDDLTVKLVGVGGTGAIVARYGAMWLASLAKDQDARLVLIDQDSFEASNESRMFFSSFGNKAAVTRADLLPRLAHSRLTLLAIEEFVTAENCGRLLQNRDIIITTVDNHATRKLINDYCSAHLDDVVVISGGNDGVGPDSRGRFRRGTYGNCQIYVRRGGRDLSPTLTHYHPEIAHPADQLPGEQGCTKAMASVPQLLLANMQTATAILSTLCLYLCGVLHYSELAFDIAEGLMRPLPLPAPVA